MPKTREDDGNNHDREADPAICTPYLPSDAGYNAAANGLRVLAGVATSAAGGRLAVSQA